MTPTRWERVSDLFDRAADLDRSDRSAFLDAEAVGPDGETDAALREEVERLLASNRTHDDYLEGGVGPGRQPEAPPPDAGPWQLRERVGRGGMGEVWRAERAGDYQQTAAVKLVHLGLGDALLARFRSERQILASLNHPAIAQLLDGGTASDGRPYLATEFIDGETITDFADRRRLGVNERLALFLDVCEAVAYAHTRLVVHRDLKPSNVLVTESDGEARVTLLDFGIAKLLDADDEALTRTGRPVMTPAYAAPEQEAGGTITTATDVYGLGVLLYEMMTGTRPTSRGDVTRLSDVVTSSAETAGRVPLDPGPDSDDASALRSTTLDRLRRRLRGDLDQIALKALRADPERRYQNAAELAADVQRHLDGMAVEARPESVGYRVGKFVGRNRALVVAAAVALVAVVGGAVVSTIQSQRVLHEQRVNAAVSGHMLSLFRSSEDPSAADSALTVAEVTRRGARRVETDLAGQPEAQAEVYRLIAEVYLSVGRAEAADSISGRSVELWESVGEGRSAEAALSRTIRGFALNERGEHEEAERVLARALADLLQLGSSQRDDVADTQARLAEALVEQGRAAEAVPLFRQALATRKALHGDRSANAQSALNDLNAALWKVGSAPGSDAAASADAEPSPPTLESRVASL